MSRFAWAGWPVAALVAAGLLRAASGGPAASATASRRGGVDFAHRVAWAEATGPDRGTVRRRVVSRLLEALGPVPVTSDETVAGVVASDSAVKAVVEGAAREAELRLGDGGAKPARGAARLSLDGELLLALLPPRADPRPPIPARSPGGATGVVVDARGLDVTPALAPSLLGPDGAIVYGPDGVAEEAARARGIVGWAASLDRARRAARVGPSPVVVRATATRGVDLHLSGRDARLVCSSPAALVEARVVVVVDPPDRLRHGPPLPQVLLP